MPSTQPLESDSAVAARVSVEIRLRAVIEVRDGAPVVDVAELFGVTRDGHHMAQTIRNRRPRRIVQPLAPTPFEPETYLARRQGPDLRGAVTTDGGERDASPTNCTGKAVVVPRPARGSTESWCATGSSIRKNSNTKRVYKRWEREAPMHLWQLDLVGGIFLAGSRDCKMLTGIDDHSRFVVVAAVLEKPSGRAMCEAFIAAMQRWGVPFEVLHRQREEVYRQVQAPAPPSRRSSSAPAARPASPRA